MQEPALLFVAFLYCKHTEGPFVFIHKADDVYKTPE